MSLSLWSKIKSLRSQVFAYLFTNYSSKGLAISLHDHKVKLFSAMRDQVSRDPGLAATGSIHILEIGVGNGANLKYYPKGSRLTSVEPNPFFEKYFQDNLDQFPDTKVEQFITGKAEDMSSVASSSVDAVVSTLVLCSVDNVDRCLQEIHRVLVPGGRFYLVEHVTYNETYKFLRFVQRLIEPFWSFFGDGCKLSRDIERHLKYSQFKKIDVVTLIIENLYLVMKPHVIGVCHKADANIE
ncbi:Methyltransferase-like protein 7A [Halotydeus destructor]|nr:Methyltransferase-like protein 7A [Halotydeus destructor]